MQHSVHSLATYRAIRERILASEVDLDEETLTDTLEGLTDLHEVVAAIVRSALTDEALVEGLKGHIRNHARAPEAADGAGRRTATNRPRCDARG